VKETDVTKQQAGRTLYVSVTERTPAALVIDGEGRPAYFLDRAGYAMPPVDSAGYDVPLVRGLDAEYHPVGRVAPRSVRTVLGALPQAETDCLVGQPEAQPDSSVRVRTAPIENYGSIPVRLGERNVAAKLRRLQAFAQQILAAQPDTQIQEIDLRFDGQIVTRKHPTGG
jgi:cell division protein FtsQ